MRVQRKLRRELAAIKQKRATAQHKQVVLQKLLVDVQAGQQKEAKQAANYSKMTRQVRLVYCTCVGVMLDALSLLIHMHGRAQCSYAAA
jgi:hypothetical protein